MFFLNLFLLNLKEIFCKNKKLTNINQDINEIIEGFKNIIDEKYHKYLKYLFRLRYNKRG